MWVHSLYCLFYGLDKCVMSCIHYCSIPQSPSVPPLIPPPHAYGNHWFHCLHNFVMSTMSHNWIRQYVVFSVCISCSLLAKSSCPFYHLNTHTHTSLILGKEMEKLIKTHIWLMKSLSKKGHLGDHFLSACLPIRNSALTFQPTPESQVFPPGSLCLLLFFQNQGHHCLCCVSVVITLCLVCCLQIISPTFRAIASHLSLLWSSTGCRGPVSWLIFLLLMLKSPLELAFTDTSKARVSSHRLTHRGGRVFAITARAGCGITELLRPGVEHLWWVTGSLLWMLCRDAGKACGRSVFLPLSRLSCKDRHTYIYIYA